MGRPPDGERAMTGSERVTRWRLKHPTDKPATKRATKRDRGSAAEVAELLARIAERDQHIAELTEALAEAQLRIANVKDAAARRVEIPAKLLKAIIEREAARPLRAPSRKAKQT
jgi:uncharacterized coiled-coil protein SlyX